MLDVMSRPHAGAGAHEGDASHGRCVEASDFRGVGRRVRDCCQAQRGSLGAAGGRRTGRRRAVVRRMGPIRTMIVIRSRVMGARGGP